MGLEKKISNLNPKIVKLFDNIISILLVVTLIYVLFTFVFDGYISKPLSFFGDPAFTSGLIICIFLGVGYKMLHGGTLHFPEQSKQKTEIKMPDVWGVKKYKKEPESKPTSRQRSSRSHRSKGSWNCPKCHFLNVRTTICKKCNYKK